MAAINLVDDLFLLALPLSAVWSLSLPIRKKISVSAMFLIGLMAFVSNACELYLKKEIAKENSNDFTWDLQGLMIATVLEMTMGLLIPCVPAVAVLLRRCRPWAESKIKNLKKRFARRKEADYSVSTRAIAGSNSWETRASGPYMTISEPMSAVIRGGSHGDVEAQRLGSRDILRTTEVVVRPSSFVGEGGK
ncbi:hypothetical protein MMC10_009899 [Thelotrema lepadinum]|nr:hypothetical protein [Thelotrema lepadinum]